MHLIFALSKSPLPVCFSFCVCVYVCMYVYVRGVSPEPTLQVYTYLLRPLTAPGRPQHSTTYGDTTTQPLHDSNNSISSRESDHHLHQQQQGGCGAGGGGTCSTASRQGSGSEAAVVGWELQLVMEHCPLVSRWFGDIWLKQQVAGTSLAAISDALSIPPSRTSCHAQQAV